MSKLILFSTIILIGLAMANAQTPVPAEPQTAAECLSAVQDYPGRQVQAARKAGQKPNYRQYLKESAELAQKCAAQFTMDSVKETELASLAKLYDAAKQPGLARAAIKKGLAASQLSSAQRAELLVTAIGITIGSKPTEQDLQQAESYAAQLDAMDDAPITRKIEAHSRLGGYYSYADLDARNLAQHETILALINQLSPEEKKRYANQKSGAYQSIALVHANRGMPDKAIEVLKQGQNDLADAPSAKQWLDQDIRRYSLIGQPGAPIKATYWINADSTAKQLDLRGKVTLLQFTAHWCIPCRNSYPAILKFHDQFSKRGLEVVFSTQLYGYFDTRENLKPEEEVAADKEYYAEHHHLPFKIAIEPRIESSGNGEPPATRDNNEAKYIVGGIPQIVLLDKQGVVRMMMIGWDPANETRMTRMIETLLKEPAMEPKPEGSHQKQSNQQ